MVCGFYFRSCPRILRRPCSALHIPACPATSLDHTTAHDWQCLTLCHCQVSRACPAAFAWTRRLGRLDGRLAHPGLRPGLPGRDKVAASPQAVCHAGQRPSSGQPASLSSR
eukprot:2234053-Pleurochrysis_carterae.AAC.1